MGEPRGSLTRQGRAGGSGWAGLLQQLGSEGGRVAPSGLQKPRARRRGSRGQLPSPAGMCVVRAPGRKRSPLIHSIRWFTDSLPPLGSSAESAGHRRNDSSLSSRSLMLFVHSFPDVYQACDSSYRTSLNSFRCGPGPRPCPSNNSAPRTTARGRGRGGRSPAETSSASFHAAEPGAPQNPFEGSQKTMRHNFTVIIFERFLNRMKKQLIRQGVTWKVSHRRDQPPVSAWQVTWSPEGSGRSSLIFFCRDNFQTLGETQ